MKHLLNTLFVTTEDAYATLDGENILIKSKDSLLGRFPLHILESIFLFTYSGASPALIGKCADLNINLVFMSPRGKFLARTVGESHGNVLLRKTQYRISDDPDKSCEYARNMIFGKVSNCRQVLNRTKRDHPLQIDVNKFENASHLLLDLLPQILNAPSLESLRGFEGSAASIYFNSFDDMILKNKDSFSYTGRNRRPPTDNINALLSYAYSLLANDCSGALEMVGLDSFVGFLHRDVPGRKSLALDIMEELRPCIADRFVITLINQGKIHASNFEKQESGAVFISKEGKKIIHKEWQTRKQEIITHPYLKEKLEWGLVPYVQSLLLSRSLRGDLDGYPPFLWK